MAIATRSAGCRTCGRRRLRRVGRRSSASASSWRTSTPHVSSGEAMTNHGLLTRMIADGIEEIDLDLERIPFTNDSGFHTLGDYLARTTQLGSREDADAWLARLAALPGYYEQNVANVRRGVRDRLTQPRIVAARVLELAKAQAAVAPESSPLLLPFARMPATIPADVQADYRAKGHGPCTGPHSACAARLRGFPREGVRARCASGAGLAVDAQRRSELPLPRAPGDDDVDDARRDSRARALGGEADPRPDGPDDP